MDSWPTDNRLDDSTSVKRRNVKNRQKAPHYPVVGQGTLNSATLVENDGRLKWTTIAKYPVCEGKEPRPLHSKKPAIVFPPVRPAPLYIPRVTIEQRAEHGVDFLRTYLPDVVIPVDLIKEEVAKDTQILRNLETYDPYAGNLLETVIKYDHSSSSSAFLAFPMGVLNRHLNLSPFKYTKTMGATFAPSAVPIRSFDTPIRQIVSSTTPVSPEIRNTYLAVRTFGSVSFMELKMEGSKPQLSNLGTIISSDVGDHTIADIILSPSSSFEALIVNGRGAVYRCSIVDGRKTLTPSINGPSDAAPFWRLSLGETANNYLLASSKAIVKFDRRANTPTNMFSISDTQDAITSIEDCQSDQLVRACSTNLIFWIDPRVPEKPLLSYKHDRQFDHTLQARTIHMNSALTTLASRKNGLMTIYDVSRSEGRLLHVNTPPYCLTSSGSSTTYVGSTYFRHPFDPSCDGISLFRLSERGSIFQLDLHGVEDHTINVEWSNDIKTIDAEAARLQHDVGPLGAQYMSEVDLSSAYDKIFRLHTEEAEMVEEEKIEAVYELVDKLPTFWQGLDAPVEHLLTLFDVVFRAGNEPDSVSRADFLTESIANSTRGYRALIQGRLSAQPLKRDTSWHYNIAPILNRLGLNIASDPQKLVETLRQYDLVVDSERTVESLRRETKAREQLALDLSLATDVFSALSFRRLSDIDHDLETMTEALSLGGEPPSIEFGHLRPLPGNQSGYRARPEEGASSLLGVRLLLKDWEVGTDPENFVYRDPYDGSADPQPNHAAQRTQTSTEVAATQKVLVGQSQRPPMVLASSSIVPPPTQPQVARRVPIPAHSETALARRTIGVSSQIPVASVFPGPSQEYMASTQVVPGPYGGRPAVAKKKAVKKRVGGF